MAETDPKFYGILLAVKEKQRQDKERRMKAAEKKAEAMADLAKANMKIAEAIFQHAEIMERSLALLRPAVNFSRSSLDPVRP